MQVQQSQGKDAQEQNDFIKLSQCVGEGCKITYILNEMIWSMFWVAYVLNDLIVNVYKNLKQWHVKLITLLTRQYWLQQLLLSMK